MKQWINHFTRRLLLTLVAVFMTVTAMSSGTVARAEDSELLKTDKDVYVFGDPIMVTAQGSGLDWVGLYKKGETYDPGNGGAKSIYWYYVAEKDAPVDILTTTPNAERISEYGPGEYTLTLFENDSYNAIATKDITVESAVSLSTDKSNYTVNEPVKVTATGGKWVGVYKKGEDINKNGYFYAFDVDGKEHNIYDETKGTRGATFIASIPGPMDLTVYLFADEGKDNILETVNIHINSPTHVSSLDVASEFNEGDAVDISVSSDERDAWVGIYEGTFTASDTFSDKGIESFYVCYAQNKGKAIEGLAAGKYTAVLFSSSKYAVDKVANFEVKGDVPPTVLLSTDKDEYLDGEPIMVTAEGSGKDWVGLYKKGETPGGPESLFYFYVADNPKPVNILDFGQGRASEYGPGEYTIYLLANDGYEVLASKDITVKEGVNEISLDREGYPAIYTYGEPVLVSAESSNPAATIRMCDESASDTYGFDNGYYVSLKVSDIGDSVDIVAKAIEAGNVPEAGKTYRVYLISPTTDDPNNWAKQVKFTLEEAEPELLSTDKEEYTLGDPIMVTTNFEEENAWVGLYKKGEALDGSVKSIFWYYVSEKENPVNILDTNGENGRVGEYGPGEYTVVLYRVVGGDWYVVVDTVDIKVNEEAAGPLSTDKKEYTYGDPIMVTADFEEENAWVGLYKKGEALDGSVKSIFWYYVSEKENPVDILNTRDENGRSGEYGPGEYTVVLYRVVGGDWYVVVDTVDITVKEEETPVNEISLDREGRPAIYNYGEPVLVTAKSSNPAASIRMCDESASDTYGFDNGYYASVKVSDITDSVDIVAKAIEAGNVPEAGKVYRVYLITPTADNSNFWVDQVKFQLEVVYYDDDAHLEWTLAKDKQSATVTFSRTDGVNKPESRTTSSIVKAVKTEATCTETGIDTYTATYEFGTEDALITANGKTSFSHAFEAVSEALGHDWGEWTVVKEPTETEPGTERRYCKRDPEHYEEREIPATGHVHNMTHYEAKAATCEKDGNTEYWHCTECGRYFEDEAGEKEIEKDSWILKAFGHKYGEWQYDEEKDQHFRVCEHDPEHVEREDCHYKQTGIKDGVIYYECEICHGKKEVVALSTDKKEYDFKEPIMVNANLDAISDREDFDHDHAWIGIYPKGVTPGPNLSIYWYYIAESGNPFNVLDGVDSNNLSSQFVPGGEYSIFLCQNEGYDYITSVDVKIKEEIAGEIGLELNGVKQTSGQQTTFSETDLSVKFKTSVDGKTGSSWIGLYSGKISIDLDFKTKTSDSFWYIRDILDEEIDITSAVSKPGWYTMVIFGDGGYDDKRMYINFEVAKEVVSEKILKEPTCEEYGSKEVTYKDGTTELIPIDPLGHDWGEWTVVTEATCEKAGEEQRICKRDEKHVETKAIDAIGHAYGNWKFNEETHQHTGVCEHDETHTKTEDCTFKEIARDGNKVTYQCEICGGKYTEVEMEDEIVRIFDTTRFGTSIKAADELKMRLGVDKFETVIIADGRGFADALTGSYLAYVKNAPILLTADKIGNDVIYDQINKYIKENIAENGTIYVLGGKAAVSDEAIADLASYNVKRLDGANRLETNLMILKEAGASADDLVVCTAFNYADSLSAAAAKKPILLVADHLTDEQKTYIAAAKPNKFYIVGGTSAVGDSIYTELGAYGKAERIAGASRFETSVEIAKAFFAETDSIVLTYGLNFPDGLCGGPVAAVMNAPIILAADGFVEAAGFYADDQEIKSAIIFGGPNSPMITDENVRDILRLDKDTEIKVK